MGSDVPAEDVGISDDTKSIIPRYTDSGIGKHLQERRTGLRGRGKKTKRRFLRRGTIRRYAVHTGCVVRADFR